MYTCYIVFEPPQISFSSKLSWTNFHQKRKISWQSKTSIPTSPYHNCIEDIIKTFTDVMVFSYIWVLLRIESFWIRWTFLNEILLSGYFDPSGFAFFWQVRDIFDVPVCWTKSVVVRRFVTGSICKDIITFGTPCYGVNRLRIKIENALWKWT